MRDNSTDRNVDIWQALATIYPVKDVLVIGSPPDSVQTIRELSSSSNIILADAGPDSKRAFSRMLGDESSAKILETFVAQESRENTYFELSIKSESGMVSPDSLSMFWPNIHATSEYSVNAIGIVELLEGMDHAVQWMLINRLDSLALCSRIKEWGALPHVLSARVAVNLEAGDVRELTNAAQLIEHLSPLGYSKIAELCGGHPHLKQLVFARRAKELVEEADKRRMESEQRSNERAEAMQHELDQAKSHAVQQQSQLSISENNLQDLRTKHQALVQHSTSQGQSIDKLKTKLLELRTSLDQVPSNELDDA